MNEKKLQPDSYHLKRAENVVDWMYERYEQAKNVGDKPKFVKEITQVLKVFDRAGIPINDEDITDLLWYRGVSGIQVNGVILKYKENPTDPNEREPITTVDLLPIKQTKTWLDFVNRRNDSQFDNIVNVIESVRKSKNPNVKEDQDCIQRLAKNTALTGADLRIVCGWVKTGVEKKLTRDRGDIVELLEYKTKMTPTTMNALKISKHGKYIETTTLYVHELLDLERRAKPEVELF